MLQLFAFFSHQPTLRAEKEDIKIDVEIDPTLI